jgi:hypothetical protein
MQRVTRKDCVEAAFRFTLPDPTYEQEWQESESYGASVLQEAPHLRQLPPTLDGARHDTLREMQSGTLEVPEIALRVETAYFTPLRSPNRRSQP